MFRAAPYPRQLPELDARPPEVGHRSPRCRRLEAVRGLQDNVARAEKGVPLVRRKLREERPAADGYWQACSRFCLKFRKHAALFSKEEEEVKKYAALFSKEG